MVGFKKIAIDPNDTLSRRIDPLIKRKRFVMGFEAVGAILGLFLFIFGLMVLNSETVTLLKSENSSYSQDYDLTFKIGNTKVEFFS